MAIDRDENASTSAKEDADEDVDGVGGGTCEYWNEQMQFQLGSKQMFCMPGVWTGVNAFGGFGDGAELVARSDVREEIFDR